MIRKTLITNHPWLPVRITAPAQFDALDPSNKKYTHTHTHHTRFYSLGWAWVCGWGADNETASTVEGESAEVKGNTGVPTTVHARDVCKGGLAFLPLIVVRRNEISKSFLCPATDSDDDDLDRERQGGKKVCNGPRF